MVCLYLLATPCPPSILQYCKGINLVVPSLLWCGACVPDALSGTGHILTGERAWLSTLIPFVVFLFVDAIIVLHV